MLPNLYNSTTSFRFAQASRPRGQWTLFSLIVADAVSLSLAVGVSLIVRAATGGVVDLVQYARLAVFFPSFVVAYGAVGLYSGVTLSPPEEIRRCTLCSAAVFVLLATMTVSLRGAATYITVRLLVAIGMSAVLLPLLRMFVRRWLGRQSWWGHSAIVFGSRDVAGQVADVLRRNPELGLKPVAIVASEPLEGNYWQGFPVWHHSGTEFAEIASGSYAVICAGAEWMLEDRSYNFAHLLVIPEVSMEGPGLFVGPRAVGNLIGFELRRDLALPSMRYAKRCLDLVLSAVGSLVAVPVLVILAVWVRLSSPGPVFYRQARLGRGGKGFHVVKFRTMAVNASELLEQYLAKDPELRAEWERDHKLRNDPRVTSAGRFLRLTSLDELPQLWNVLKGEMSLVGPRPIVHAEIVKYGECYRSYVRVPGGITGLWQVSGRSNTTYEERVRFDEYYIQNWSVWMDL